MLGRGGGCVVMQSISQVGNTATTQNTNNTAKKANQQQRPYGCNSCAVGRISMSPYGWAWLSATKPVLRSTRDS